MLSMGGAAGLRFLVGRLEGRRMAYAGGFRERMVQRMTGPAPISALALARESGVSQQTLSRWRVVAHRVPSMNQLKKDGPPPAKSPRQWAFEEKLKVVLDAAALRDVELGAFLRERGLHMTQLASWRAALVAALAESQPRRPGSPKERQRIRALEKELLRKDRALAEVTALLALRKKVEALLGDADDDTSKKSDR